MITIDSPRIVAYKLAIKFSDDLDIPSRYREKKVKQKRKVNEDSKLEKKFNKNIEFWFNLIKTALGKLEKEQAWRFIRLNPNIEDGIKSVTECKDFLDFNDYLILRRDTEQCNDEELGRLAMLITQFQKEIDIILNPPNTVQLKNQKAQELMEQETVIIDGAQLNLWHGHNFNNVKDHMTWNKIKSFTELNGKVKNKIGDIVFTGTFQVQKKEVLEYAVNLGFAVHSTVSRNTDYVVYGSENVGPNKIADYKKQIENGSKIQLMGENEFLSMVADFLD